MSVLDNLNKIKSCKEDIKQAIIDKGVDMSGVSLEGYATKISEIQTGGGSGDYLDIRANLSTYYSTVESVPDYTFAYCGSLTTVNLPNCVSINDGVFDNCSFLQSVNLPMCGYVGEGVFKSCKSLKNVNLPNCSSVGSQAFISCSSLQSIDLPNCKYVGGYAFAYCSSLQSIDLPNLFSVNGQNQFSSCASLQSIFLPRLITTTYYMFANCLSLSEAYIPMCLSLDKYTFQSCSSLSVLDLRSTYSCSLYNSNAFSRTPFASGIGSIYVHAAHLSQFQKATNWTYFSNCLVGVGDVNRPLLSFENGKVYGDTYILGSSYLSYLNIKSSSVTSINLPNVDSLSTTTTFFSNFSNLIDLSMEKLTSAPYAMCSNCLSLQSVNLPMCEYIGDDAFYYCSSLQSVNLPNCSYVGYKAFYYCSSLQSVNLPNCSYIGRDAFYYCSSLTSIDLPMCEYIGENAFNDNEGLTLYIGTSLSSVCELHGTFGYYSPGPSKSIFVPMSLVDTYKSAPYWSYYSKYIFGI